MDLKALKRGCFGASQTNVNENIGIFCQIAMKLGDSRVQDFEIEI